MNKMNKKSFTVLLAIVLVAIGFGFYRGWFVLSSPSSASGSNKVNVNLTVDPDKARGDAEAVKKKTTSLTGNVTEGVKDAGDTTEDKVDSK